MATARKYKEVVGMRFGALTILSEAAPKAFSSGPVRRVVVQCDCGSPSKEVRLSALTTKDTKSCGCIKATTHGMSKTRQYQCWADMRERCDNSNHESYVWYGERGVSYPEEWKTFERFWEDMKDGYSDTLTLNRISPHGDYSKSNCEWATKTVQSHARRKQLGTICAKTGVSVDKNGKFVAAISYEHAHVHLGVYATEELAAKAYDYASNNLYGDTPNNSILDSEEIRAVVEFRIRNKDVRIDTTGEKHPQAKLNNAAVLDIMAMSKAGETTTRIGNKYSIDRHTVSAILRGQTWNHVTGLPTHIKKEVKNAAVP